MKILTFLSGLLLSFSVMAAEVPTAQSLIFETDHIANLAQGTQLVYDFVRTSNDVKSYGPDWSDTITIGVTADKGNGKKDLAVQMFTGERARELQTITDIAENPMFQIYFGQIVSRFSQITGGHIAYIKSVFVNALATATVEKVTLTYNSNTLDGYKISLTPFLNDPNAAKMKGYQGTTVEMVVSADVPGHVALQTVKYSTNQPFPMALREVTTLQGYMGLAK